MRTIVFRRWYAVLIGVVCTFGLVYLATVVVPAKYEAQSHVLLLPPTAQTSGGANPYLSLSGYEPFADVVASTMTDSKYVVLLRNRGVTYSYGVARDLTTTGPVIVITVDGDNSAKVIADLATVTAVVPAATSGVQQVGAVSVAPRYQLTSKVIKQATEPETIRKSQIRAALVALVAGLFVTALTTSGLDRLLLRRRRRGDPVSTVSEPDGSAVSLLHPERLPLRNGHSSRDRTEHDTVAARAADGQRQDLRLRAGRPVAARSRRPRAYPVGAAEPNGVQSANGVQAAVGVHGNSEPRSAEPR